MGLSRSRDQRIADDFHDDAGLMCQAHNCPNRWSVDAGNGRLCSAHAWAEPHLWPIISEEQRQQAAESAYRRANGSAATNVPPLTKNDKAAILARLRGMFSVHGTGGKDWAHRLRDREAAGERLSLVQRDAWRDALAAEMQAEASEAFD